MSINLELHGSSYVFTNFAFLDFGAPELIIILAIILLLFGGKKLPEISKGLGESMRELRKGLSGNLDDTTKPDEKPSSTDAAKKPDSSDKA
jgi:sec-independent protein translocase protein TatA